MSKKLEIGNKIVIYPEGGHRYTSLEAKNGLVNQDFNSSNFPKTLTAVFLGIKKGKDGKWYEKYTLKSIPKELNEFCLKGKLGFVNLIEELDAISKILQGRAEDGRKILYSRSINIEDVNEILGVVVDYKNKKVYQKDYPSKNINELANFGKRRKIFPFEAKNCSAIASEFIKKNQLECTAYSYIIEDLKISEKRKEIVLLNDGYYLASRSVYVYSSFANFCEGYVRNGVVSMYRSLFYSNGYEDFGYLAVRPVFYLESDIQKEVIEEQQEEKELKEAQEIKVFEYLKEIKKQEEKITKMQKDLNKEVKKLDKMLKEALKLV